MSENNRKLLAAANEERWLKYVAGSVSQEFIGTERCASGGHEKSSASGKTKLKSVLRFLRTFNYSDAIGIVEELLGSLCNCHAEMRMGECKTGKNQHDVQYMSESLKKQPEVVSQYIERLNRQLAEELKIYDIETAIKREKAEAHVRWEFERYLGEGQHPYAWVGMHQEPLRNCGFGTGQRVWHNLLNLPIREKDGLFPALAIREEGELFPAARLRQSPKVFKQDTTTTEVWERLRDSRGANADHSEELQWVLQTFDRYFTEPREAENRLRQREELSHKIWRSIKHPAATPSNKEPHGQACYRTDEPVPAYTYPVNADYFEYAEEVPVPARLNARYESSVSCFPLHDMQKHFEGLREEFGAKSFSLSQFDISDLVLHIGNSKDNCSKRAIEKHIDKFVREREPYRGEDKAAPAIYAQTEDGFGKKFFEMPIDEGEEGTMFLPATRSSKKGITGRFLGRAKATLVFDKSNSTFYLQKVKQAKKGAKGSRWEWRNGNIAVKGRKRSDAKLLLFSLLSLEKSGATELLELWNEVVFASAIKRKIAIEYLRKDKELKNRFLNLSLRFYQQQAGKCFTYNTPVPLSLHRLLNVEEKSKLLWDGSQVEVSDKYAQWVARAYALLMLGVRGSARGLGWLDSRSWEPYRTPDGKPSYESASQETKWEEDQEERTVITEAYTFKQTQRKPVLQLTQWEYEGSAEDGSVQWREDTGEEVTTAEELTREDEWVDSAQRIVLSIAERKK